jgi:hypothetical protein
LGEGQGVRAIVDFGKEIASLFAKSPHPNPLPEGEETVVYPFSDSLSDSRRGFITADTGAGKLPLAPVKSGLIDR